MKYLILLIMINLFASANEIGRMEAIIQDIEDLRADYNKCMKELDVRNTTSVIPQSDSYKMQQLKKENQQMREYKKLLDKERMKNTMLLVEIDSLKKNSSKQNIAMVDSENPNNNYAKILKTKEKEIKILKTLKDDYALKVKNKEKIINSLNNQIIELRKRVITPENKEVLCRDANPFPDLIMKPAPVRKKKVEVEQLTQVISNSIETEMKIDPATFKIVKQSYIYDSVNGSILYTWQENRSFTSNIATQNWIKVTGYFENKKWVQSQEDMWIKKENTIKR